MSRIAKIIAIPVIAVALLALAGTSDAKAGGFSVYIGGPGISHGYHAYGFRPSIGTVPVHRYQAYRYGNFGHFRGKAPLHHFRPKLIPHRRPFVPGHYRAYWH